MLAHMSVVAFNFHFFLRIPNVYNVHPLTHVYVIPIIKSMNKKFMFSFRKFIRYLNILQSFRKVHYLTIRYTCLAVFQEKMDEFIVMSGKNDLRSYAVNTAN
jgi:hypothetical protein